MRCAVLKERTEELETSVIGETGGLLKIERMCCWMEEEKKKKKKERIGGEGK